MQTCFSHFFIVYLYEMNVMKEEYKKYLPVPMEVVNCFEPWFYVTDNYKISLIGRVKSLNYNHTGKEVILKQNTDKDGYSRVCIYIGGKVYNKQVHRLLYQAIFGRIDDGLQIDHLTTVRDDNRLFNLKVATPKENQNNPITKDRLDNSNKKKAQDPEWLKKNGEANKRKAKDPKWRDALLKAHARPVAEIDVSTGLVVNTYECAADAQNETGTDASHILKVCKGKRKTAGGRKWAYAS